MVFHSVAVGVVVNGVLRTLWVSLTHIAALHEMNLEYGKREAGIIERISLDID